MRSILRPSLLSLALVAASALPLLAQEHGGAPKGGLLTPSGGLMFWTLVIFVVLLFVLSKFAFGPITAAVAARERALDDAIQSAKRDREEAAALLAEHRRQIEAARTEAQQYIAEGRKTAERMRDDLLEQTRQQQSEMLERAQRDIGAMRDRAIADLRREAVDLALAGASKVIERNLDDQGNRRLVEGFFSSLDAAGASGVRAGR